MRETTKTMRKRCSLLEVHFVSPRLNSTLFRIKILLTTS